MYPRTPNRDDAVLEPMLKESIDRFLTEFHSGATDFSNISSIFSRLLHTLRDPPLEVIWFYSALKFHSVKLTTHDSSSRVLLVKDLVQLLVSFSSPHNVAKNVVVLAPVIYELYSLVRRGNCCVKEVEDLLEGICSYVSLFCGCSFDDVGDLNLCVLDLIRVWIVEEIGENCEFIESLKLFCPLVSGGVLKSMVRDDFGRQLGLGLLAGVVTSELFLLRLCLKLVSRGVRAELETELCNLAVSMISSFRNYMFLDILLRMLLEPVLPVISILNSEDELFLKGVLSHSVMTVDYSFICPAKVINPSNRQLKTMAVTWLFVADKATRYVRQDIDKTKGATYVQAFVESCLPSLLTNWVMNQQSILGETSLPDISSPLSVIKWLLVSEDRGVKVFDNDNYKMYAKSIVSKADIENEFSNIQPGNGKLHGICFHYPNNKRECGYPEMIDSVDTICSFASEFISVTNGTRKRKEDILDDGKQTKFGKCHLTNNSVCGKLLPRGDDNRLNTRIKDPIPGEDTVFMDISS